MKLASHFWADMTTLDFAALAHASSLAHTVAVLPVAATEQHGPHLPLNVDSVIVDGIIQATLPHLTETPAPILFLPTQTVSKSNEHAAFAGTLSHSTETVLRMWCEIGACVAKTGIKKLVLFNSHGGNVALMDLVARDLREQHGLLVFSSSWYNLPFSAATSALFSADEHRFGVHAGDLETSLLLALRPELVRMPLAQNFHSASQDRATQFPILGNGKSAKLGWQTQDYNPHGAVGNAANATCAKGQALVHEAGLLLAQMLQEVSQLPLSTLHCANNKT